MKFYNTFEEMIQQLNKDGILEHLIFGDASVCIKLS